MIALPIISIVCCVAYVLYTVFRYGVPVSISETYYLLPNKWDWLFSAWTVLTSVPIGIYWWSTAPSGLKWIPVTVMIALLLVGAACCYKSGPKAIEGYVPDVAVGNPVGSISPLYGAAQGRPSSLKELWRRIVEYLKAKFNPKDFFKYGPARLIHYVNSLVAIILTTVYFCIVCGGQAVASTVISYFVWIAIGMKVDGVYNPDYSLDVNNKVWIFFMEIICLLQIFVFVW